MKTRALELHASSNIWDPDGAVAVLDLMVELDLNTLVIHEISITDRLVYPGRFFGSSGEQTGVHRRYRESFRTLYQLDTVRRSRPYQHLGYMRWVARHAAERGIKLFLNNKELSYPDALLRVRPDLLVDGTPCPTAPGWIEFLEAKYDELFADFPELAGMVTSPGTSESRLSISSGWCMCDRCRSTNAADWYAAVIETMHAAARQHGKTLVLRDFTLNRDSQDELTSGLDQLPDDVVVSFKNTPHDYYPTFPDNPRIGQVGSRPQWVELDAMGQYFGMGIAPAIMTADLRQRLQHARANSVEGVLIRIDYEGLEGHSALRTVNALNVYAAAAIAVDPEVSTDTIYRSWARKVGAVRDDIEPNVAEDAVRWLREVLEQTWSITARTVFVQGCVFSDSSQFPVSIEHAYWLAEEKNSLHDWDPTKESVLSYDAANVELLLLEKREARRHVTELVETVVAGHPGLDVSWHTDLRQRLQVFATYVTAFDLVAQGVFAGRHIKEHGTDADHELQAIAPLAVERMQDLIRQLRGTSLADWHPAGVVLSAERLECLAEDVAMTIGRHDLITRVDT